jgi:glutamine amidotransferase
LLVLPGVGAFGDGMAALRERGLDEAIRAQAAAGKPLLGICLGAQMLLDGSEEFGHHAGLGLIPGQVRRIPSRGSDGRPVNVPHMGWANLQATRGDKPGPALLRGTGPDSAVYFVHSLHALPEDADDLVASCRYAGHSLSAMLQRGNVHGCQFHPEKSGPVGLNILRNYLETAA